MYSELNINTKPLEQGLSTCGMRSFEYRNNYINISKQINNFNFHNFPLHLDTNKIFYLPTDA